MTRHRSGRRRHCMLAASALAVITLGCTNGGPMAPPPSPSGAIHSTFPIDGRPYGLAVVRGRAEVTRLDADSVTSVGIASPVARLGAFVAAGIPTGVAATPDGSLVIVASQVGSVTVHDAVTGTRLLSVSMPGSPFRAVASRDGSRAYVTSSTGYVLPIDLQEKVASAAIETGLGALNGVALSSNGATLYVSSMYGGVTALDTRTMATAHSYAVTGQLQDVALSPDESELYVADEGGHVVDLTLSTGASRSIDVPGAFGLAVTRDGTQLWVTQPTVGTITVLDRATLSVIRTLDADGSLNVPRRVAFDESGAAVVTDEAGAIHVFR